MSDTVPTVPTDEELAHSLEGDFTSAYAEVNGVRLHYVAGGSGDPLVLLGGWPQTWWQFHKVMPALARRYRVIAVDLRGMGGSAKPPSGYDKKTMAADIHALVRHLGHDRVHLAGHDIGAMVAHAFAVNHPEATRKLALLDVAHPDPSLRELTLLPVGDGADWETAPGGVYLWWFAFNQVKGLPERLLAGRTDVLVDWLFGYLLQDQSTIDERSRAVYAAAYATPDAVRAGNAWYQTFLQDVEDFETYDRVGVPVLALAGDRSHAYLRAILPGHAEDFRLRRIEGSGHYLPEERPERVTAELVEFFA
ncbi:alpha/beta fold hydrolase [Streptomyces sp. MNP-20]|uniref:alpha/beta fold hydrolase n=1 Tax=Streptomyces sp. MNP-20 TaxID=2721165 RepID=UPI001C1E8BB9|nr:alpha/beta hydrolase [Streptomyces sp. MNP-20]